MLLRRGRIGEGEGAFWAKITPSSELSELSHCDQSCLASERGWVRTRRERGSEEKRERKGEQRGAANEGIRRK